MNLQPRFDRPHGVTLIELMVVIAVAGILAAVTAPSIRNAVRREQQRNVVSLVANHFREARNQAMARGEAVYVNSYYSLDGSLPGSLRTYRTLMPAADGSFQFGSTACDSNAVVDTCPDGSVCMDNGCWSRPARSCRELTGGYSSRQVSYLQLPEGPSGLRLAYSANGGPQICFNPDGSVATLGGAVPTAIFAGSYSCSQEGFNAWVTDREYSTSYGTVLTKMRCSSPASDYETVSGSVIRVMNNGEIAVRSPRK